MADAGEQKISLTGFAGPIRVRVLNGINARVKYGLSLWDYDKEQWTEIGDGVASALDPTPDDYALGSAASLKDKLLWAGVALSTSKFVSGSIYRVDFEIYEKNTGSVIATMTYSTDKNEDLGKQFDLLGLFVA